jgi:hypothetical protein
VPRQVSRRTRGPARQAMCWAGLPPFGAMARADAFVLATGPHRGIVWRTGDEDDLRLRWAWSRLTGRRALPQQVQVLPQVVGVCSEPADIRAVPEADPDSIHRSYQVVESLPSMHQLVVNRHRPLTSGRVRDGTLRAPPRRARASPCPCCPCPRPLRRGHQAPRRRPNSTRRPSVVTARARPRGTSTTRNCAGEAASSSPARPRHPREGFVLTCGRRSPQRNVPECWSGDG